jgi:hypothetical protein
MATTRSFLLPDNESIWQMPVNQSIWYELQIKSHEPDPKFKAMTERVLITSLPYPYYHISFETISLDTPVWAGIRPYQQVPFQWSCHIQTPLSNTTKSRCDTLDILLVDIEPGQQKPYAPPMDNKIPNRMSHHAFLADGSSDPRREFIESLLSTLGTQGTIFVYNATLERKRLQEIAQAFPEYQGTIDAVMLRIFDLLPLTRYHYYPPNMTNSLSIKLPLPTITLDLSYNALTVGHSSAAAEAFAEMIKADITSERRAELYQALLDNCELETLTMAMIVKHIGNELV